jgi:hypothetical protein
MGFAAVSTSPVAVSHTVFDRLENLAPDASAIELGVVQGDQLICTAGGTLKVEESPHGWTISPPARRNLVMTLLRPGAAKDAATGETIDRVIRKPLPLDCVIVIPRPLNAERLKLDTSDRRKLVLAWPNTSPLDNHDWGMSR